MSLTAKHEELHRYATALFDQGTDWVTFYRETLGLHGAVRHAFPNRDAMAEFEQTEAYQEIQRLLTKLRENEEPHPDEPTRVITVRLPKSLHEALRAEAHEHCTSMNKLCISKLLQFIDGEMVPTET
jgi:predicted HicB family RNase H-like nuclease